MSYVDGFVVAVPNAKRAAYQEVASVVAEVFLENGALQVVECWGDDVPAGEQTSFPMAVKCKDDESVVFSWITWPSRQARDMGNKKAMSDPRMKDTMNDPPFDAKRMIFGGFQTIVER